MSLRLGERRRLRRIERSLACSDSRLNSLYSIFTRLTWSEAMPASERLRAWEGRRGGRLNSRIGEATGLDAQSRDKHHDPF